MARKCTLLIVLLLPLFALLLLYPLPAATALPASRARRSLLGRLLKPLIHRFDSLKAGRGLEADRSDETAAATWRDMYQQQLISKIEPSNDKKLLAAFENSNDVLLVPTDQGVAAQPPPQHAAKKRVTESTLIESIATAAPTAGAVGAAPADATSSIFNTDSSVSAATDTPIGSTSANEVDSKVTAAGATLTTIPRRSMIAFAPAPPPAYNGPSNRRSMMSRQLRGGQGSPRRSTLDSTKTNPASAPASEPSVHGRSMLEFPGNQINHAPSSHALASAPCPGGPPQSGGGGSAPFPLACPNPEPTAMCDFVFDGSMDKIPTIKLPSLVTDAPLDITPSDIVTVVGGTYLEEATANTSALVCSAEAAKTKSEDVPLQFPDGIFEMRDLNALVYNGQLMKEFLAGGNDWANAFRADAAGKDGALVRVQIESAILNVYGTETKVGKGAKNGPSGSNLGGGSGVSGNGEGDFMGVQYFPYERLCVMFRVKLA
ncbi:unnamed protein product [Closterium sp. Yama58-4]|nr:unnamed protein product [Closterium sp. Yama58-4]